MSPCIAWSRFVIKFFAGFFFFFLTTVKDLAGVGIFPSWPNPFGVLKTFQVRKWTLLPSLSQMLKTQNKNSCLGSCCAVCSAPRVVNPWEGIQCDELSPLTFARVGISQFWFGLSLLWPSAKSLWLGKGKLGVIQMTKCSFQTICIEVLSSLKRSIFGFNSPSF